MSISDMGSEMWDWVLSVGPAYQIGIALAALVAAMAAVVLVVILLRALALAAGRAYENTMNAIPEYAETVADLICSAAGGLAREAGALLGMGLWLALYPFTAAGSLAWEATARVVDRWAQARERERELKALWKECYRDEFRSFRAFRRFFENDGVDKDDPRPDEDAPKTAEEVFAQACALLGLPADGSFTKKQMDERYRELVQRYHPDKPGGSNEMTARLNAARETIRNMKGWR